MLNVAFPSSLSEAKSKIIKEICPPSSDKFFDKNLENINTYVR
jgi:hypothetical protein